MGTPLESEVLQGRRIGGNIMDPGQVPGRARSGPAGAPDLGAGVDPSGLESKKRATDRAEESAGPLSRQDHSTRRGWRHRQTEDMLVPGTTGPVLGRSGRQGQGSESS